MTGRAVAVIAGGAVALAACGGGGSSSSEESRLAIRTAAEATAAVGSARIESSTVSTRRDPQTGRTTRSRSSVVIRTDFTTGDSDGTLHDREDGTDFSVEVRTVDGVAYSRLPWAWSPLDRYWSKEPAAPESGSTPTSGLAVVFGVQGIGSGSFDPTESFGILDSIGRVTEVGTESIGGASTTRYRTDVRVRTLVRGEPRFRDTINRIRQRDTATIDVWVDEQRRVRRLVSAIPGRFGSLRVRTELSQFGVPVEVVAPAPEVTVPSEVFDELMKAGPTTSE